MLLSVASYEISDLNDVFTCAKYLLHDCLFYHYSMYSFLSVPPLLCKMPLSFLVKGAIEMLITVILCNINI